MNKSRGRPPLENPQDRKTAEMKLPLSPAEKEAIQQAAEVDGKKPVTWAREILVRAANRRVK